MKDRCDISNLPEGQFEPGSRKQVLKNLLGITSRKEMEALETERYRRTLDACAHRYQSDQQFTCRDLMDMHREWLGGIYPWAGKYRQVNLSKGDFSFAMAVHIPELMNDFEKTILSHWTPCKGSSIPNDAKSLAIVHTELILIHPFREGNGRLSRILCNLMALQAGFVPLDFSGIQGRKRNAYFSAIRSGMRRDYFPMEKIFEDLIRTTMRKFL